MAEFLLKAVSATHSNATKDKRGCYKRGDVVVVMPDGHAWGAEEVLAPVAGGKFVVLKLPGVSVANGLKYLQTGDGFRRLYHVLVDSLPAGVRAELQDTGEYTTTWTAVRNFVENKTTLATESGVNI